MAKYPKFQQYKQGFVVGEDIMEELLKMAGDDMAQYFQIINDDNPSYQKALQIINNKETYNRLLGR